jgi:hypothetical protein
MEIPRYRVTNVDNATLIRDGQNLAEANFRFRKKPGVPVITSQTHGVYQSNYAFLMMIDNYLEMGDRGLHAKQKIVYHAFIGKENEPAEANNITPANQAVPVFPEASALQAQESEHPTE